MMLQTKLIVDEKIKCKKCDTTEKVAPWNEICVKCNINITKENKRLQNYGGL